jgi:alkyl hydroperoxide reductase subunit AhpC
LGAVGPFPANQAARMSRNLLRVTAACKPHNEQPVSTPARWKQHQKELVQRYKAAARYRCHAIPMSSGA